jgi:hypothetical protein
VCVCVCVCVCVRVFEGNQDSGKGNVCSVSRPVICEIQCCLEGISTYRGLANWSFPAADAWQGSRRRRAGHRRCSVGGADGPVCRKENVVANACCHCTTKIPSHIAWSTCSRTLSKQVLLVGFAGQRAAGDRAWDPLQLWARPPWTLCSP